MTNQDKNFEQELDDFINGKSELAKLYAENEALSVPAHLEAAVKKRARDDLDGMHAAIESTPGENTAKHPRQRQRWLFPVALAASVIVALTITRVLLDKPLSDPQLAQQEASQDKPLALDIPETGEELASTNKTAKHQEELNNLGEPDNHTEQIVQQRVAPQIRQTPVNDVKKATVRPHEQLAHKTKSSEKEKTEQTPDAPKIAQGPPPELPEYISDFLQDANASNQKLNDMPPEEILRRWQKSQWLEQVTLLNKQGNQKLAKRYVDAYADYYPGDSIQYLLQ